MGQVLRSLTALLLLVASSADAVQRGCASLVTPYVSAGDPSLGRLNLSLYRPANTVLFLSDGLNADKWVSLGKKISDAFPEKTVVSGDFNYRGPAKVKNLNLIAVDNTESFPFDSDYFDVVVLRRGLCVCNHNRCCGGFAPLSVDAKSFFREAVRVMNKKNPSARVVLHGSFGVTDNVVRTWTKYLEEIEREMGVRATIYFDRSDDSFMMIGIQPH